MMWVRRFMTLALITPVIVLLAACRVQAEVEILNRDEFGYSYDLGIPADSPDAATPEEICESLPQEATEPVDAQPYADDGFLGCRWTMVLPVDDTEGRLILDDDVWTFRVTPEMLEDQRGQQDQIGELRITITFPGEVIEHNSTNPVTGTTVVWDDVVEIFDEEGLFATAHDIAGGSPPGSVLPTDPESTEPSPTPSTTAPTPSSTPPTTPSAETSAPVEPGTEPGDEVAGDDRRLPIGLWIAAGVVVAIGLIVYTIRGGKNGGTAGGDSPAGILDSGPDSGGDGGGGGGD